jgi:4a-hydroxytetrahydrobiopterin dehydratase
MWKEDPMPLLSNAQIAEALQGLSGWTREGNAIRKPYAFRTFLEAVAFINAIAPLAEAANHHPEIHNVYNRVSITLSTHDAGGITEKDTALAAQIDRAASGIGG